MMQDENLQVRVIANLSNVVDLGPLSDLEEGNREAAFVSHTKAKEFVYIYSVRADNKKNIYTSNICNICKGNNRYIRIITNYIYI